MSFQFVNQCNGTSYEPNWRLEYSSTIDNVREIYGSHHRSMDGPMVMKWRPFTLFSDTLKVALMVAWKVTEALSSLFPISKLEVLDSKLEVLDLKLEVLDSRLDPRSFRVSRMEDRVDLFEFRGTDTLLLPGTVSGWNIFTAMIYIICRSSQFAPKPEFFQVSSFQPLRLKHLHCDDLHNM